MFLAIVSLPKNNEFVICEQILSHLAIFDFLLSGGPPRFVLLPSFCPKDEKEELPPSSDKSILSSPSDKSATCLLTRSISDEGNDMDLKFKRSCSDNFDVDFLVTGGGVGECN